MSIGVYQWEAGARRWVYEGPRRVRGSGRPVWCAPGRTPGDLGHVHPGGLSTDDAEARSPRSRTSSPSPDPDPSPNPPLCSCPVSTFRRRTSTSSVLNDWSRVTNPPAPSSPSQAGPRNLRPRYRDTSRPDPGPTSDRRRDTSPRSQVSGTPTSLVTVLSQTPIRPNDSPTTSPPAPIESSEDLPGRDGRTQEREGRGGREPWFPRSDRVRDWG